MCLAFIVEEMHILFLSAERFVACSTHVGDFLAGVSKTWAIDRLASAIDVIAVTAADDAPSGVKSKPVLGFAKHARLSPRQAAIKIVPGSRAGRACSNDGKEGSRICLSDAI
jgi:hypothetical protein